MSEISFDNLQRFWAKTSSDSAQPRAFHPLLCHMIDVAMVTASLWNHVLSEATKQALSNSLGLGTSEAGKLVAWISGLHDLGKASPPFTHRATRQNIHELYDETIFSRRREPEAAKLAPHGYVTASELPNILQEDFGFSDNLAKQISVMIGGHHGVFPRAENINSIQDNVDYRGGPKWVKARRLLVGELAQVLEIKPLDGSNAKANLDNAQTMIFAGLVSVADWIGSNSTHFPCEMSDQSQPFSLDLQAYKTKSEEKALEALTALGWMNWASARSALTFPELFPEIKTPHPLQQAAMELAPTLTSPGIIVVEAPMGEGKTETAMFLADYWNATLQQRGVYFALPTQATSNQMFRRVKRFLRQRFTDENTLLQLLHGHAALSAEFETLLKEGEKNHSLQLQNIYCDDCDSTCVPSVVAAEWFTHRKRGLLAPFGVGTIDQALLAILKTRHVFVRLFGLANKTIIIDEVHAYDAYMSVLLEQLLEWLAALGSPVILLSATLPIKRRDALVRAYQKGLAVSLEQSNNNDDAAYPRITWATATEKKSVHLATSSQNSRTLFLRHLDQDATELSEQLREALTEGGCAAVICNTVKRAQEVYQALKPYFPEMAEDGNPELDLLHARFLFTDRAEREKRALRRFGKQGNEVKRPHRAILVATQIIEQSLDLDFDLMISEHAPVDLLLQRSGRLHRHQRENRPPQLRQPTLWIAANNPENRLDFGVSAFVYDEHVLLRSQLALQGRDQIAIPEEVSELIEFVYDERACPEEAMREAWEKTFASLQKKRIEKESNARINLILRPAAPDFFQDFNPQLEEDNPEFHKTLQASTRDDDSTSLSIVVLRHDEMHRANVKNFFGTRWLLEHSVNISNRQIVFQLIAQGAEKSWQDNSWLRHHRLITLDENDQCVIGNYQFRLDQNLGIVISKISEEQ